MSRDKTLRGKILDILEKWDPVGIVEFDGVVDVTLESVAKECMDRTIPSKHWYDTSTDGSVRSFYKGKIAAFAEIVATCQGTERIELEIWREFYEELKADGTVVERPLWLQRELAKIDKAISVFGAELPPGAALMLEDLKRHRSELIRENRE